MSTNEVNGVDAAVAGLDPIAGADVEADAAERERVHKRAIQLGATAPQHTRPSRRLSLAGAAAVITAVAAILVLVLGTGSSTNPTAGPEFAAAAIRVAEANPRYLIAAPGWSVSRASAFGEDGGEMTFSDGESSLDLTWYPARFYNHYLRDRAQVSTADRSIQVDGAETTTVHYGGTEYATMLPPQGNVFVEVRGALGSLDSYRDVVGSLHRTDVNTWLAAMPPKAVQPREQADIVDRLLEDVPLPPGFDLAGLRSDLVLDGKTLREGVATVVACGWLDSWAAADDQGNAAAKADAVSALAGAKGWPAFAATNGHSKETIQRYAETIANGRLDRRFGGGVLVTERGSFAFGPAYAMVLGCDSITKRRINE